MDFGEALKALKAGQRVAREGWNGKGMHLQLVLGELEAADWGFAVGKVIQPGHPWTQDGVSISLFHAGQCRHGHPTLPHIAMQTASGAFLNGWLASQTDMLAEDWCVVED